MSEKYKNKYRIQSNRAQWWNYSAPGSYFITICTNNREEFLGHVENKQMVLSEYGKIVESEFLKIPTYHQRVILGEWCIMPNHVHCIITLGNWDFDNGIGCNYVNDNNYGNAPVEKIHEFSLQPDNITKCNGVTKCNDIKTYRSMRRKMIIPKICGKFQMQTSKYINLYRQTPGFVNWQRDYYEHIIRNNKSYNRIENYIKYNPANWNDDRFYS